MSEASGFIRAQPDFIPSFYLPKGKYTYPLENGAKNGTFSAVFRTVLFNIIFLFAIMYKK